MRRAGPVHIDASGLWSFVVDTAPLGAPGRRVIVAMAEWLEKPVQTTGEWLGRTRKEAWLGQSMQGKAEGLANRSCGTGVRGKATQ